MDDFICPLKSVESIEEWVQGENDKNCPPCLIAPLASYYVGVLEKAGETDKAEELKTAFEKSDVLTIAKHLDNIKTHVGDKLKQKLVNLDCMAQIHKDA